MKLKMEPLTIEDLKHILVAINFSLGYPDDENETESLLKSRSIIHQLIKDKEFERDQTTLPKI